MDKIKFWDDISINGDFLHTQSRNLQCANMSYMYVFYCVRYFYLVLNIFNLLSKTIYSVDFTDSGLNYD